MTTQVNPFLGYQTPSPGVSLAEANTIVNQRFGLVGTVRGLESEKDQNFLVETDDGRYVLKIANPAFASVELDAQNAAMVHLAECGLEIASPLPLASRDGDLRIQFASDGAMLNVRLLTYVEGRLLASWGHLAPDVLRAHGALAARTAAALASFEHPGLDRVLQWDCRRAAQVVEALSPSVEDRTRRELAQSTALTAEAGLAPLAGQLPEQAIHGDLTDVNVLAVREASGRPRPAGLIDLGDLIRSWRVAELAVAIEGVLSHDFHRPLQQACTVLQGFHDVLTLEDVEIEACWLLIALRAAADAVSAEHQLLTDPANRYVARARERDWRVLEAVVTVPTALAHEALRHAAGLPASPMARAVHAEVAAVRPAPILDADGTSSTLDLSVTSELLAGGAWTQAQSSRAALASHTRPGGIGRYAEARLTSTRLHRSSEHATVHLGVDVLAAPGDAVRAPIAGTVRSVAAGTIVLAGAFFDVRMAGLDGAVEAGSVVTPGALLGRVTAGAADDPLPPHVHVQAVAVPGLAAPEAAEGSVADAWLALCPDPTSLVAGAPAGAVASRLSSAALLARRRLVVASPQENYYREPPRFELGWREHLVDTDARAYVDMVNNVAVVGHSHPHVERAVARQLRLLNTNSRFNYAAVVDYAERIVELLPEPLDRVFFVSSGSEANDLALRLMRIATGGTEVLAFESAYHGWTTATDAISTSVLDNPRARTTRPEWLHPVSSPNVFRGEHRGPDAAQRYAEDVRRTLTHVQNAGRRVAGLISEAVYGNAGGVLLPDGYLRSAYADVRDAGGLCIADEVQVGYGRLGEHFWGFEQQGVVPDIVTMAKASGNGMPVGFVATRRELADAFLAEGSFFASVGGAPASCAAGLAVLDVLRDERLQWHALDVGNHLRGQLAGFVERFEICGAVHGMGLYLGLELVRDRETLEPASDEALAICERMLEKGIVVQPTSDGNNVLKIKPPLCITRDSVDFFLDSLERTLVDGW